MKAITFLYTGDGCAGSDHDQPIPEKANCTGDVFGASPVSVSVAGSGLSVMPTSVALGGTFTVTAASQFPSATTVTISSGALSEVNLLHTSCSQPLFEGDQFGSLLITDITFTKTWTRTATFYQTHPDITQDIIDSVGGLTVCGKSIADVDVDHGHSAIEGMCVGSADGERGKLLRHLIAAALNESACGGIFTDFAACDALCQNPAATNSALKNCREDAEKANKSGEKLMAPFDPPSPADDGPCDDAFDTDCTVLSPGPCAAP